MEYSDCLSYLRNLGNEVSNMKFDLETIRALLREMGEPQHSFPSVLIAGTNGKGSVARFLSAIASAAGIKTGLFTSPHLIQVEERIRVNGRKLTPEAFAHHFTRVIETVDATELPRAPTYFELLTATAFRTFASQKIRLAVVEVGMGGRLDSTNVVEPLVSIITRIAHDHGRFLGNTLAKIAREKAGIMRRDRPCLSAPQEPEVVEALCTTAGEKGASLRFLQKDFYRVVGSNEAGQYTLEADGRAFQLETPGIFQVENAALALLAAEELRREGFSIETTALRKGLESTRMPGVLEPLDTNPLLLFDGGHNPAAAAALAAYVQDHVPPPRVLVFGIMQDKDVQSVLEILAPHFEQIFLTSVNSSRAADPEDLLPYVPWGEIVEKPREALRAARATGLSTIVAGSFYLVGQLLETPEASRT